MNHEDYLSLTWKEKNERIGKIVHLYQNNKPMFDEFNRLLEASEKSDFFKDVEILPDNNFSTENKEGTA